MFELAIILLVAAILSRAVSAGGGCLNLIAGCVLWILILGGAWYGAKYVGLIG